MVTIHNSSKWTKLHIIHTQHTPINLTLAIGSMTYKVYHKLLNQKRRKILQSGKRKSISEEIGKNVPGYYHDIPDI